MNIQDIIKMKDKEIKLLKEIIIKSNNEIEKLKKTIINLRMDNKEIKVTENTFLGEVYIYNFDELIDMLNKQFDFMKFEVLENER